MKQQRGVKIAFSRSNDNYTDYDDDTPDDIDYRTDQEGNIHGYIREITCTPDGGSTDWDRHFRGMESLGGQSGDINTDYAVGAPATKPTQQTASTPKPKQQTTPTPETGTQADSVAIGRHVIDGVKSGTTPVVVSDRLKEALSLLSLGIDSIENWSVEFVKIFSKDIGIMAKVGAALTGMSLLSTLPILALDLTDGEVSPRDKMNATATTVSLGALLTKHPIATFTIGLVSFGLYVYALTLPGDGESQDTTQYQYGK